MNLGIKGQSGTGEIEPSSACYTAFDGERPPGGPRGVGVERVGRTGGRWWIRAGAGTGGEEESGGGRMICSCRLAQRAGGSGEKASVDETRCEMMHLEGF